MAPVASVSPLGFGRPPSPPAGVRGDSAGPAPPRGAGLLVGSFLSAGRPASASGPSAAGSGVGPGLLGPCPREGGAAAPREGGQREPGVRTRKPLRGPGRGSRLRLETVKEGERKVVPEWNAGTVSFPPPLPCDLDLGGVGTVRGAQAAGCLEPALTPGVRSGRRALLGGGGGPEARVPAARPSRRSPPHVPRRRPRNGASSRRSRRGVCWSVGPGLSSRPAAARFRDGRDPSPPHPLAVMGLP